MYPVANEKCCRNGCAERHEYENASDVVDDNLHFDTGGYFTKYYRESSVSKVQTCNKQCC